MTKPIDDIEQLALSQYEKVHNRHWAMLYVEVLQVKALAEISTTLMRIAEKLDRGQPGPVGATGATGPVGATGRSE